MDNTYKNSFRNLVVWKEAKKLTIEIYKITKEFPREEIYAMTSQLRRAACSVMANIAEGNAKNSKRNRVNFFNIAQGSLAEIDCFLELAKDLKYINDEEYGGILENLNKTGYLLAKFIKAQ